MKTLIAVLIGIAMAVYAQNHGNYLTGEQILFFLLVAYLGNMFCEGFSE